MLGILPKTLVLMTSFLGEKEFFVLKKDYFYQSKQMDLLDVVFVVYRYSKRANDAVNDKVDDDGADILVLANGADDELHEFAGGCIDDLGFLV